MSLRSHEQKRLRHEWPAPLQWQAIGMKRAGASSREIRQKLNMPLAALKAIWRHYYNTINSEEIRKRKMDLRCLLAARAENSFYWKLRQEFWARQLGWEEVERREVKRPGLRSPALVRGRREWCLRQGRLVGKWEKVNKGEHDVGGWVFRIEEGLGRRGIKRRG